MKKKFLSIRLAAMMLTSAAAYLPMTTATVFAADQTKTYEDLTYKVVDGGIEITKCDSSALTVEIPNEIDGQKVISIGNKAFLNCYALMSVTLPDSLQTIGMSAFENCRALISVEIPESVTTLGSSAFKSCKALTSVKFPESLT